MVIFNAFLLHEQEIHTLFCLMRAHLDARIVFGGFSGFIYLISGCFLYCSVIGIPLARQLFKLGRLSLAPFGLHVETPPNNLSTAVFLANFIWYANAAQPLLLHQMTFSVRLMGLPLVLGVSHLGGKFSSFT